VAGDLNDMLLLFDSRVTIYPYFLMLFDAVSVLIILLIINDNIFLMFIIKNILTKIKIML